MILRFGAAFVLTTAGCVLLWAGVYRGGFLFGLAVVCFMPRSELNARCRIRDVWMLVVGVLAFLTVMLGIRHLLPGSVVDVGRGIISHPAFVAPLWLCLMWGLWRHYRLQSKELNG
jgi:hypothetical protein